MSERSAWPLSLGAALLLWPAAPTPCAAQTQPPPGPPATATSPARPVSATVATATSPARPAPGTLATVTSPSRPVSPADLPPSTVSPAIERFMKLRGNDLPPPSPPPIASPAARRPVGPAATAAMAAPAALPATSAPPRVAQRAGELPPLPGPATPPRSPAPEALMRPSVVRPASDPLATGVAIKPAPLEPTDLRFPINLATALRLSDARPLIVAAAQAGVWMAEADLTRAKLLWVPSVILGLDYIRHDGGGPDINKGIMTAPSVNFFYGGPGLVQFVNLTDVIFEPLAARQVLTSRQWDIQSAKNDALMQTADAYFQVHQRRGMYAGALYCVERGRDLVDRIANLSRELVPKVEVDRARNMLADLEQLAVSDRQEWRVQSANLTQVLRLDPRAVVEPLEHDHTQVTLIDPSRSLDELMPIALANRPELWSRRAQVEAAEVRVRREKARPFLPIVALNGFQSAGMVIQGGIFIIGPNSSLNQTKGRDDVSVQLAWQLENFGFGNLAKIKAQRSAESKEIIRLRRAQDTVAADVMRALAGVQSGAARVIQADRALRTAIVTFNGHLEGLGQTRRLGNVLILAFRPQEAVYSLQQLNVSFDEYFTTVADYNRAQFELFHALGYPAREVAAFRSPGEALPVDLARPAYLPPVGHGPPPATR